MLVPLYYIRYDAFSKLSVPPKRLDDAIDAFHQLAQNPQILIAILGWY
jgi:hypothetical protein